MSKRRIFTVRVEQEDPWWVARVDGVRGSPVQARRVEQIEDKVRSGIALLLDIDYDSFDLTFRFDLPADLATVLEDLRASRQRALEADRQYAEQARRAATATADAQMSVRDAAAFMGMSHQRVQQLRKAS